MEGARTSDVTGGRVEDSDRVRKSKSQSPPSNIEFGSVSRGQEFDNLKYSLHESEDDVARAIGVRSYVSSKHPSTMVVNEEESPMCGELW